MNREELKEIVVSYVDKVFFYCIKRCNNRMDAEDLSQTILLEALSKIDSGVEIENIDYYIWGICKNKYNSYLRNIVKEKNNNSLVDDIDVEDESSSALDQMIQDEKIRMMNQAIKLLSKDYSEILYAYYIEDKTLKTIAEELKLPLGTVTWKLSVTRNKLKEYLKMEKLNGKKAYIPKNFATSATYTAPLSFDLHDTVKTLFVKNLLYHTYNNPCTIEDISLEMGMAKPYVEDVVGILLGRKFIVEENGRYKSNVVFVDRDIVEKVDDAIIRYQDAYIDEIINFSLTSLEQYKSIVENKDIPDKLLLWSLILMTNAYTYNVGEERTKKVENIDFNFCLIETNQERKLEDWYISWNGFGSNSTFSGSCFPAANRNINDPKIHDAWKTIFYDYSCGGFNLDNNLIDKVLYSDLKYSELDNKLKEKVDLYMKANLLRLVDDKIYMVTPVITKTDFTNFKKLILNNQKLEETYGKIIDAATKAVKHEIPEYLQKDAYFVVISLVNIIKSQIIKKCYDKGIIEKDKDHDFFAYNAFIVKNDQN